MYVLARDNENALSSNLTLTSRLCSPIFTSFDQPSRFGDNLVCYPMPDHNPCAFVTIPRYADHLRAPLSCSLRYG